MLLLLGGETIDSRRSVMFWRKKTIIVNNIDRLTLLSIVRIIQNQAMVSENKRRNLKGCLKGFKSRIHCRSNSSHLPNWNETLSCSLRTTSLKRESRITRFSQTYTHTPRLLVNYIQDTRDQIWLIRVTHSTCDSWSQAHLPSLLARSIYRRRRCV